MKVNRCITEARPRALQPIAAGWEHRSTKRLPPADGLVEIMASLRGDIFVLSAVEDVEGDGLSWHVSVSQVAKLFDARGLALPVRAPDAIIRKVFADFGMNGQGFDEDNHAGPDAKVRNFWLQVAPDKRAVCHCKAEETPVVQPFGDAGGDGGGEYVHRDDKEGRP